MWTPEWVSAVASCVYTVLTFALLLIVWNQFKGVREQLRSTALQGIWSLWVDIDKWFVEHPELKPFFYHREIIDKNTSQKLKMQIESTCELMLDCYSNVFSQINVMTLQESDRYKNYMRDVYQNQPVFKNFVDEHPDWYAPDFVECLREPKKSISIR